MRMNMSDFATFFAVARNQSFRAAGDELGLSSSAISHSIKTLEQRLKIRLFNRTTRSVSLTEAGSNLYERLRPAFDEIQIMLDEMNDFRLTPTGTLKINAARVAARIFLMPLLVGFTREYPDIKVELTTDDSLVDIVQQGFDAGVRLSGIVEKDMISVAIGPPVKLCVACSCPLISRQGLYLKLTLPADVDILAESDNPTHYADGFHCNARSPLQGYAMPFLHSVSA